MIKGVGRYAVEVSSVESEFFDRVICFVRPQYAGDSSIDLHREAERVADGLSAEVEEAQHGSRYVMRSKSRHQEERRGRFQPEGSGRRSSRCTSQTIPLPELSAQTGKSGGRWIPMLLSAGGGAVAAILITAMF